MDDDLLQTAHFRELEHRFDVRDVAVNAAIGEQPENMQRAVRFLDVLHRMVQRDIIEENPVIDGFGDAGELLIDDASGADIEVTDLGVAHLTLRQPDGQTACGKANVRIFGENRVQVWCACGGNGVPVGRRVETETVQYH